jgi:hypothetical protein
VVPTREPKLVTQLHAQPAVNAFWLADCRVPDEHNVSEQVMNALETSVTHSSCIMTYINFKRPFFSSCRAYLKETSEYHNQDYANCKRSKGNSTTIKIMQIERDQRATHAASWRQLGDTLYLTD